MAAKRLIFMALSLMFFAGLSSCSPSPSKKATTKDDNTSQGQKTAVETNVVSELLVMSYNVHNLFDAEHDVEYGEDRNDYEFLAKAICVPIKEKNLAACIKKCDVDKVEDKECKKKETSNTGNQSKKKKSKTKLPSFDAKKVTKKLEKINTELKILTNSEDIRGSKDDIDRAKSDINATTKELKKISDTKSVKDIERIRIELEKLSNDKTAEEIENIKEDIESLANNTSLKDIQNVAIELERITTELAKVAKKKNIDNINIDLAPTKASIEDITEKLKKIADDNTVRDIEEIKTNLAELLHQKKCPTKDVPDEKCVKKCNNSWDNQKKKCVDWTEEKVANKIQQIKKVFDLRKKELKENSYPQIVGLVEIENEIVTKRLADVLGYKNFKITRGPDKRGVDVALLYNENDNLKFVSSDIHILHRVREEGTTNSWKHPNRKDRRGTRAILEVEFIYHSTPLHVFVNHWPSLHGDTNNRLFAAERLRKIIERRHYDNPKAHFLALGDFNTQVDVEKQPELPHPFKVLTRGAQDDKHPPLVIDAEREITKKRILPNHKLAQGSYHFNDYSSLDRFFFSENSLDKKNIHVDLKTFAIFNHPDISHRCAYWGCSKDAKPWSFDHKKVKEKDIGFSDHYPIYIKLQYRE